MGLGVKASVADIGTDEAGIVLLDEAVIILLIRSAAGDLKIGQPVLSKTEQGLVEEFRAVIRMELAKRERQAVE